MCNEPSRTLGSCRTTRSEPSQLFQPRPSSPARRTLPSGLAKYSAEQPNYVNGKDGTIIPGCRHYAAFCEQKASCCGVYYPCRQCHDEVVDNDPSIPTHQMNRFEVKFLRCTLCGNEQSVDSDVPTSCNRCQVLFASYACMKCMLFHNANDRDIYHCVDCGICRQGKRDENIHCSVCDACISNVGSGGALHRCRENSIKGDCPICIMPLFTSVKPVVYLPCGHALHETCFQELAKRDYRCCLCFKSMADMSAYFRQLDTILAVEGPAPEVSSKQLDILCNDCGGRSRIPFHYEFWKCRSVKSTNLGKADGECGSYNTRIIGQVEVSGTGI